MLSKTGPSDDPMETPSVCSYNWLSKEKGVFSWNGYAVGISNFLINKLKLKYKSAASDADLPRVWVYLPYLGKGGKSLVKSCIIYRILLNSLSFMTLKKFLIFVPTRTKFRSYLVVMSFMKSLVQDAWKLILAKPIDAFTNVWQNTLLNLTPVQWHNTSLNVNTHSFLPTYRVNTIDLVTSPPFRTHLTLSKL